MARNRLSRCRKKSVRVALGQKLERALAHFGADERELGMQLPRFDVAIRGRLVLVDPRLDTGCRSPGDGSKPMFEFQHSFKGNSTHSTSRYRRRASLT